MNDPRYSDTSFGTSNPVVNIMDNRRPLIDFAIVSMLTLQFLLLGLLAWKMLSPPVAGVVNEEPVAQAMVSSVDQARDQAYREILRAAVTEKGVEPGIVDKYTDLKTENARMLAHLDGQLVRAEKFAAERDAANSNLQAESSKLDELNQEMTLSRRQNEELVNKLAEFEKSGQENGADGEETEGNSSNYLWWSIVGGMLAIGGASGYIFGHRKGKVDAYVELGEYDSMSANPADDSGTESSHDSDRITLSLSDDKPDE